MNQVKSDLSHLEPAGLWREFNAINQIPRTSRNEAGLVNHIKRRVEAVRLAGIREVLRIDEDSAGNTAYKGMTGNAGNLIVSIRSSKGCEEAPTVVLQAHGDMVAATNPNVKHDWSSNPIESYILDGYARAIGTSLGADNGIAVAAMLAFLGDRNIRIPPLELLFTVREEEGLVGAANIELTINGRRLINLDSEDVKKITIATAGGATVTIYLTLNRQRVVAGSVWVSIDVSGLAGGHSGLDIHRRRASAPKILSAIFTALTDEGVTFALADVHAAEQAGDGGEADNKIVTTGTALVAIPPDMINKFEAAMHGVEAALRSDWGNDDPKLCIKRCYAVQPSAEVLTPDDQQRVLGLLAELPHGVQQMSDDYKGVVETSANLAAVCIRREDTAQMGRLVVSMRSLSSQLLRQQVDSIAESFGGWAKSEKAYPAWEPEPHSRLLHLATSSSRNLFGETPELEVVHAGLECSLLVPKLPGLEVISIGPTIKEPHTPRERVDIASVQRFWDFLVRLLGALADDTQGGRE